MKKERKTREEKQEGAQPAAGHGAGGPGRGRRFQSRTGLSLLRPRPATRPPLHDGGVAALCRCSYSSCAHKCQVLADSTVWTSNQTKPLRTQCRAKGLGPEMPGSGAAVSAFTNPQIHKPTNPQTYAVLCKVESVVAGSVFLSWQRDGRTRHSRPACAATASGGLTSTITACNFHRVEIIPRPSLVKKSDRRLQTWR